MEMDHFEGGSPGKAGWTKPQSWWRQSPGNIFFLRLLLLLLSLSSRATGQGTGIIFFFRSVAVRQIVHGPESAME